jgi:hypothetical protein
MFFSSENPGDSWPHLRILRTVINPHCHIPNSIVVGWMDSGENE